MSQLESPQNTASSTSLLYYYVLLQHQLWYVHTSFMMLVISRRSRATERYRDILAKGYLHEI